MFDYDTQKEGDDAGKVVDCDGNIYDLPKLIETYGESAYIVKTRSGGFHVYCKLDADSPQQTTKVKGCIDVRNTNGYVVGAESPGYEAVNGNIRTLVEVPTIVKQLFSSERPTRTTNQRTQRTQRTKTDNDELINILEAEGFTGVEFRWDNVPYNFHCDQIGGECPLCGNKHDNNNREHDADRV